MEKSFIAGLLAIVEKCGIAELEFSQGDQRIKIVRRQAGASALSRLSSEGEEPPIRVRQEPLPAEISSERRIVASMPGLFYRSPSPGAKPFVSIGDEVEESQTLALLEAMKMLTPVEADLAGRIASIEAADGATVERGALLFTIYPRER